MNAALVLTAVFNTTAVFELVAGPFRSSSKPSSDREFSFVKISIHELESALTVFEFLKAFEPIITESALVPF